MTPIRKQHAVGPFIADCAKSSLSAGWWMATRMPEQVEYDEARTRWLNEQKHYRVIRFTNDEVMRNVEAVVERIRQELKRE